MPASRQVAKSHRNPNWINQIFNDDRLLKEFQPTTDVSETEKDIKVVCNLPGMTKEDVKIDVDEQHNVLTVSGEVKKEKKEENEKYHCVERSVGSFSRSVQLPKNIDLDGIKANLEHGVLRVTVPKKVDETKKRTINID